MSSSSSANWWEAEPYLACQRTQSSRRGFLSLGGILQLSGRQHCLGEMRAASGYPEPFNVH